MEEGYIDEAFDYLLRFFGPNAELTPWGTIEVRMRISGSVQDVRSRRGAAGLLDEHYLQVAPLSKSQIALYVYGFDRAVRLFPGMRVALDHLLETNDQMTELDKQRLYFGMRIGADGIPDWAKANGVTFWENSIRRSSILAINGINRADPTFAHEYHRFALSTRGTSIYLGLLINAAMQFSRSSGVGHLTGEVQQAVRRFALPIDQVGSWNLWHNPHL